MRHRLDFASTIRLGWQRMRHGSRGLVLAYHRVGDVTDDPFSLTVSPEHFAEHLQVIRSYGRPAVFRDLVETVAARHGRRETICITFDDGYADNLHVALPLLQGYDVPATVFLVSGAVAQRDEFWWDEITHILHSPAAGATSEERHEALMHLYHQLRDAGEDHRQALLADFRSRFRYRRSARQKFALLTGDDLDRLAQDPLVEIGAHTATHPYLPRLDDAQQFAEIATGKAALERMLGREIASFTYPFGAFAASTPGLVRQAGFRFAGTVEGAAVAARTDAFRIPRLLVPDLDGEEFARAVRHCLSHTPAAAAN